MVPPTRKPLAHETSLITMSPAKIKELTGRSESWLRDHFCVFCDQHLWATLRHGCAAYGEKCDPTKKDFTDAGRSTLTTG